MKRLLKALVVSVLGWQVRRLYKNNHFITIGVAGSTGKSSTKNAIARVLAQEFKVQYQNGNYNDVVTVPLVFFGKPLVSLYNPLAWLRLILDNEKILRKPFPYELVVLELGTDGPGQIKKFKKYLDLDYVVVTALTPEHMHNFNSLDDVAAEELSVQNFAKNILVNSDLCPSDLLINLKREYKTYGQKGEPDFHLRTVTRRSWSIVYPDKSQMVVTKPTVSNVEVYSISASLILGRLLRLNDEIMLSAVNKLSPMPGRMNILTGLNGSIIIDDTYNSSPDAVIYALNALYDYPAKHRIALLGNMNELGKKSEELHRRVGSECNPERLALLVTMGKDANSFLATEAEAKGCKVIKAKSPSEAAAAIKQAVTSDTAILVKGSQNGVFLEEAVKLLLANKEDEHKLVRQSGEWMKKKKAFFGDL